MLTRVSSQSGWPRETHPTLSPGPFPPPRSSHESGATCPLPRNCTERVGFRGPVTEAPVKAVGTEGRFAGRGRRERQAHRALLAVILVPFAQIPGCGSRRDPGAAWSAKDSEARNPDVAHRYGNDDDGMMYLSVQGHRLCMMRRRPHGQLVEKRGYQWNEVIFVMVLSEPLNAQPKRPALRPSSTRPVSSIGDA